MKKTKATIHLPVSGKKASLGVALDDHLLMYVEALATSRGISISRFGEFQLESDSTDTASRTHELEQIFTNLHRRSQNKTLRVALPDGAATFFEMTIPESDPFLMEHMIEREIKKAIGDRHEFVMQTEILYREKEHTKVAVTLLPQPPIDDMKALARKTNFKLEYVGLSTEVAAELIHLDAPASIIVAIKARESSITILSKGSLVLEDVVPTGTDVWIEKIMEQFGLSKEEAEQALFFDGLSFTTNKNALTQCLRGELRKLVESAEKIFLYWHVDCRKEKECRVRQVTLVGSGATIPGLASHLEASLHIETKTPEPFKNIPLANDIPELTEAESLKYLPALALALKGFRNK